MKYYSKIEVLTLCQRVNMHKKKFEVASLGLPFMLLLVGDIK